MLLSQSDLLNKKPSLLVICRYKWLIYGANLLWRQTRQSKKLLSLLCGYLEYCIIYFGVQMGDMWWDADHPCMSFSCSDEGIQTVTKVCPVENCEEVLNTFTALTTAAQYFISEVVFTIYFCNLRRTGYGISNTAALHVRQIKI